MNSLSITVEKQEGNMKSSCKSPIRSMDSNKRIRADDDDKKRMIHALENEVIQKQSLLNDIPKTSFEIALMKLSEYQKVEIEKLQTRVSELEKQDEAKADVKKLEETELEKLQTRVALLEKQADDKTEEVKRLKEGTKVMKGKLACYLRFCCNRDETQKKTVDELTKSLNEKTESIESLEELTKVLTVKELSLNDELQQARKLLIRGIGEIATARSIIGVKRMGELDSKAFGSALKGICSSSSAELISNQSVLLCNFWEQMLRDQAWHPFKITMVDGKHQELIDEEDKLLKGLKNEWGERAYFAVVNALVEMNKYNPSGRNPVQELWNFKENRRATVMEGVAVLVGRLKKYRTPTPTATMSTFRK
ncbi:hypothetical protein MKW92_030921 [Papaver armeniacum]|nr:hypothetical protein MKW92_030921 [Papaver armeniacum]